jgi:hypothetical protein
VPRRLKCLPSPRENCHFHHALLDQVVLKDWPGEDKKGLEDFLGEGTPLRKEPPILLSVTAADLELAAAPGKSEAQIAARKAVAEAFYRVHTEPEDFDDAKIKQHLKGIDYTKPVKARRSPPPPPPDTTTQWQVPNPNGKPGKYFGNPGSRPTDMGVFEYGLESSKGPRVVPKVESKFKITPETPVLESTAAGINDVWSLGPGTPFTMGEKGIGTKGGAVQYFVPKKDGAVAAQ